MNESKRKGTDFESAVVSYLNERLGGGIERRALAGKSDRGDVSGVTWHGLRVVLECKACKSMDVPKWLREAESERQNDNAALGVVVAKRVGVGKERMGEQLVMMTLDQFAHIIETDMRECPMFDDGRCGYHG